MLDRVNFPSTLEASPEAHDSDIMDSGVAVDDFINTGRTGRRNAMADILDAQIGSHSAAGIDFSMDKLSVSDSKSPTPDPSKSTAPAGNGSSCDHHKS